LWEIDKLSDIEARIVALEQAKDRER